VIVSQLERRVEHFQRLDSGQWLLTFSEGDGALASPGLDCRVPLLDIYADIDLVEDASEAPVPPSAVTTV